MFHSFSISKWFAESKLSKRSAFQYLFRCPISVILKLMLVFGFLATVTGCGLKSELPQTAPQVIKQKPVEEIPTADTDQTVPMTTSVQSSLDVLEQTADDAAQAGDYRSALNGYNLLLSKYPLEKRGGILDKIKPILSKIEGTDLELILNSKINRIPESMLLYQLGLSHLAKGEQQRANEILKRFVASYPSHPDAKDAQEILSALRDKSFQRDRIGCLLPLTGKYSVFGEKALKGIQMAIRDLTPIYPDKIRLIVKDTESDNERATLCVQELARENVAAIAGPLVTSVAAAVEAEMFKIPMICMTQKSEVTEVGSYIFANFLTPELQVSGLLTYAYHTLGIEQFGVIYPDDRYGNRYMTLFSEMGRKLGVEIAESIGYPSDKKDFGDVVRKTKRALKKSRSQSTRSGQKIESAVFIPDSPRKLAMILPQFAYNNFNDVYLLGTNLWHHPYLILEAADYAKNTVITEGFFPESQKPETADFAESFKLIYEETPGFIEAIAYDTIKILIQTAMDPNIESRMALKHALAGNRIYEGGTGKTMFDETGKAHKELFFLTVKQDKFVEIGAEQSEESKKNGD